MKIIIECFDKLYPMIATNEEGYPLIFEDSENIDMWLENYQDPKIVYY